MTMKTLPLLSLVSAALIAAFAGAVSAKPALKDVAYVLEGIIVTGIAYEISEKCDSISPRRFRGLNYLFSLRNHAFDLGYTRAEVDAYIDNKAEEKRLKQIAYGRLRDLGAVAGNGPSYCAVGQSEIAKNSAIGRLLR